MDKTNSITIPEERKRGQHLGAEERGAIQRLKKLGYSNRAIAREINCSPSTVCYELKRGTSAYCGRGRKSSYSAKRSGVTGFSDIKSDDWFADSMAKAYKMGIIKGSDGKMNPNSAITRKEVFVILARAFKMQPVSTSATAFTDIERVAAWAK